MNIRTDNNTDHSDRELYAARCLNRAAYCGRKMKQYRVGSLMRVFYSECVYGWVYKYHAQLAELL